MQAFLITFTSVLVGGGLAGATVVGLIHSQTAPPAHSPASVSNPTLEYGSSQ